MLKVSTFCSGIGSPEQALKNLGIEHKTVFACEIDKYARQSYLANHECETMYHDMTKEDYIGEHWYSDINIAGIPCQAFSLAGKRLGELDPRGLLFFDFYRYVKNQKPKYFIIENVKGLLSDNNGATFQNWINLLGQSVNSDAFMFPHEDSLMYNLHWQVLNTKDYGLPQNRERVFLIGIRNDLPNSFVFPKGVPLKLRLKDILEDKVDEKYYLSENMLKGLKVSDEIKNDNLISIIGHSGTGGQKGDIYDISGISGCLSATDYKQPKQIKVQSATASGYEIATEGDSINLEHPNSETRRGRVGKQVAQTLTTSCNQGVVEYKSYMIYDDYNGNVKKDGLACTLTQNCGASAPRNGQKVIEITQNGTSNCLTSVQKDNLVIQINPSKESGGVQPYQQNRVYDSDGIAPALCRGKSDLNITEIIQLNNPTHSNDRIYSDEGISPTLNTMQGGNRQPFIATEVASGKCKTTSCNQGVAEIIQYNIRQKVKVRKSDVDIIGLQKLLKSHKKTSIKKIAEAINRPKTEVEHWFRTDKCFSIPDAEIWFRLKGLLSIDTNEFDSQITEFIEKDNEFESANRIYDERGISPTLTCTDTDKKIINKDYRIRKLTPLECFRLQGFPDEFVQKAIDAGVSNSQLYKQAGNSITTNVIQAILKNLLT